jgi:hypothetical protein
VYVSSMGHGNVIQGKNGMTVGLECSQLQGINACAFLKGLSNDSPWFSGVLAQGLALPGPIAAVLLPRPRNSTGACDVVTVASSLWL